MTFEFSPDANFDFVAEFGRRQQVIPSENSVTVPASFGEGSIRKVEVQDGLTVFVHEYTPREAFTLRRLAPDERTDRVTIIFYRTKVPPGEALTSTQESSGTKTLVGECAIEISSNDLASNFTFPPGREAHFIVVGISTTLLRAYLQEASSHPIIQQITGGITGSFLYYVKIWPEIDRALDHLCAIRKAEPFGEFSFRIKTEELIYLLFRHLLKREGGFDPGVSRELLEKLQAIKSEVMRDLATPPVIAQVARAHAIGQTQLNQLFRQVYGDSIYHFFQRKRMDEAAYLLRHTDSSVSEVGFRLGFTNMSHFGRLFKQHLGRLPKQYASLG